MIRNIAIAAIAMLASPASADWQYTRWHMTTQELQATSPNIVPTTPSERRDQSNPYLGESLLKSGYNTEDLQYIAYYMFRENKLVAVNLSSTRPQQQGPTANMRLEKIYGPPYQDKSRRMAGGAMFCTITDRQWRSERDGNVISVNGMLCNEGGRDFFSVRYEPILSTGRTGL